MKRVVAVHSSSLVVCSSLLSSSCVVGQRRWALESINPASTPTPTPTNTEGSATLDGGGGGRGGGGGSSTFNDPSGNYSSTGASGLFPTSYDNSSKLLMQDLSYDIQKKLKTAFYDPVNKRCTLCNETLILPYGVHCNYIMHATRQAVLERVLSGIQGPPELVPQLWWSRLSDGKRGYGRLRYLSHNSKSQRRRRIIFMLHFLLRRGVIRESLGIFKAAGQTNSASSDSSSSTSSSTSSSGSSASQAASAGFSESSSSTGTMSFSASSYNFQRHEMVGDSVVKYLLPDRIAAMFPVSEGGVEGTAGQVGIGRISNLQHVIDSNEGLLKVYDYLDLDHMIGFRLPNSKTKSDVVESLFGELQGFLWAMDVDLGSEGGSFTLQYPISAEYRYLYAMVEHLLNEISHSVLIWAAESALETASEFIKENYKAPEERIGKRYSNNFGHQKSTSSSDHGPPPPSVPPPPFYTVRASLLNRLPTPKEKAQKLVQSQYPPPQNLPAPYLSRVGGSGVTYKRKPPPFLSGAPITRVLKSAPPQSSSSSSTATSSAGNGSSSSPLSKYRRQMKEWFEHYKQTEEIQRSAQGSSSSFDEEEFYRVLAESAASSSSSSSGGGGNKSSNRDVQGDLMSQMAVKDEQFELYYMALRKEGKQLGVKGFHDDGVGVDSAGGGAGVDRTPGSLVTTPSLSGSGGRDVNQELEEANLLRKQEIVVKGMKAQLLQSYKLCAQPDELPVDDWVQTLSTTMLQGTPSTFPSSSTADDGNLLSLATEPTNRGISSTTDDALIRSGIIITTEHDAFVESKTAVATA